MGTFISSWFKLQKLVCAWFPVYDESRKTKETRLSSIGPNHNRKYPFSVPRLKYFYMLNCSLYYYGVSELLFFKAKWATSYIWMSWLCPLCTRPTHLGCLHTETMAHGQTCRSTHILYLIPRKSLFALSL